MTGIWGHDISELFKMEMDIQRLAEGGREDLKGSALKIKELDKLEGWVMMVGGFVWFVTFGCYHLYSSSYHVSWFILMWFIGLIDIIFGVRTRLKAMTLLEEVHAKEFPDGP